MLQQCCNDVAGVRRQQPGDCRHVHRQGPAEVGRTARQLAGRDGRVDEGDRADDCRLHGEAELSQGDPPAAGQHPDGGAAGQAGSDMGEGSGNEHVHEVNTDACQLANVPV